MWIQQSFKDDRAGGVLYLAPTPIGNLEDITVRTLNILKSVDMIAAEDTRQTMKLCSHFGIHAPLVSYHEHNKKTSGEKLLKELREGADIALVTDAGTPAISDPGYELVVQCIGEHIPVIPLPGANAAITGLIASGVPTDHFIFYGFLPRHQKDKKKALLDLEKNPYSIIFYESPHRVKDTLEMIFNVLGNRKMALCRELTKKYETFVRGSVEEIKEWLDNETLKGECCLIVEGESEAHQLNEAWWKDLSIEEHVDYYVKVKKETSKEAIKRVAKEREMPKREVYQAYHIDK
ncbi:16S rRNA (cytidine1402-2'-O)-methyltransferase [Scopulibacillus daqui]|uniref:Ribosomal RNA small subunit methyltransferase I n=1 Tax=Scopulibacillus daqui TaxID=1469162 RepID=A0ABS2Q2N4_9BACL|nr:16S rRNA (cytidine(1402)-2'-O)-methyltransferase [Scopulibacillus daqui]MBM7646478.1 16S rRNA (cytidine1402-2'-O)-methyltransferase [Scopulibacillus daqui]